MEDKTANTDQWRGLMNSEMLGICEVAEQLLVSQQGVSFVELTEAGKMASQLFSCLTPLKFVLSNMILPPNGLSLDVAPVARNIARPKHADLQSSHITTQTTTRRSKYTVCAS